MRRWRSERSSEAVLVDESTSNSAVNGELRAMWEEQMVGGAPREEIHFWVRPCRSQNEKRGCGNCVGSSGEVTRAWQNG